MNIVKIRVCIDTDKPSQVKALNQFLLSIGSEEQNPPVVVTPVTEQPDRPVMEVKKGKQVEKVEKPAEIEKPEETEKGIKIEDVRALLAKKVTVFRSEIKTKLTEFGAPNVTALDEDKYEDFMAFLNGLK